MIRRNVSSDLPELLNCLILITIKGQCQVVMRGGVTSVFGRQVDEGAILGDVVFEQALQAVIGLT